MVYLDFHFFFLSFSPILLLRGIHISLFLFLLCLSLFLSFFLSREADLGEFLVPFYFPSVIIFANTPFNLTPLPPSPNLPLSLYPPLTSLSLSFKYIFHFPSLFHSNLYNLFSTLYSAALRLRVLFSYPRSLLHNLIPSSPSVTAIYIPTTTSIHPFNPNHISSASLSSSPLSPMRPVYFPFPPSLFNPFLTP